MKKKVPGADETFLKHEKSVCCFRQKTAYISAMNIFKSFENDFVHNAQLPALNLK